METTISTQDIEKTYAWQNLNKIQKSFALKRKNREIITNAVIVHKSTGIIPSTAFGYNLAITKELILGESVKFDYKFGGKGNKIENLEFVNPKNDKSAN